MAWQQLTLECDARLAQRVADWLEQNGAEAVTLQDAADQPLYEPAVATTPLWNANRVTGLLPEEADAGAMIGRLGRFLAPDPLPQWQVERLEDQPWERAWMEHFQPQRFGDRLWIVPSWHTPPEPEAVNVLLDPGLAFGTGTHPTTQLCLEWLDQQVTPGVSVVDYGCGSGILAVAAARLGAARVLAVDNDPQALLATRENAERNGVADRIEVCLPKEVKPAGHDLLVANILAGPLVELAAVLTALVRPGGRFALSGLLQDQAAPVAAAYAQAFDLDEPVIHDGWARVQGRKRV